VSDQHLDNYNKNRFKGEKSNDPLMDWIFEVSGSEAPESDVDAAWEKMQAKMVIETRERRTSVYYLRIAASVTLLAVFAYLLIGYVNQPKQLQFATVDNILNVDLPDGSKVTLAPKSLISFPEEFGSTRDVKMEGEAYFDIQKNEAPFVINLNEINVRVLGTAFNVDARGDKIKVAVERGLVAMEKDAKQVKIAKGQEGIFNKRTFEIMVDTTPSLNSSSWRTGEFTFSETPLSEVVFELEKYYQVKFKISQSLTGCRVTANFNKAPLSDVLDVLETILAATVEQENDQVRIKGKGCQ